MPTWVESPTCSHVVASYQLHNFKASWDTYGSIIREILQLSIEQAKQAPLHNVMYFQNSLCCCSSLIGDIPHLLM